MNIFYWLYFRWHQLLWSLATDLIRGYTIDQIASSFAFSRLIIISEPTFGTKIGLSLNRKYWSGCSLEVTAPDMVYKILYMLLWVIMTRISRTYKRLQKYIPWSPKQFSARLALRWLTVVWYIQWSVWRFLLNCWRISMSTHTFWRNMDPALHTESKPTAERVAFYRRTGSEVCEIGEISLEGVSHVIFWTHAELSSSNLSSSFF